MLFRISLCLCAAALTASAHVNLVAPNGGVILTPGTTYVIRWQVAIQHNTTGWNLHYSLVDGSGPWTTIALSLPAGDPTAGAMHSYYWTVPNLPSGEVLVRVTQVNQGSNYDDESASVNEIIPIPMTATPSSISGAAGGTHVVSLSFPSSLAGLPYVVGGSVSGPMTSTNPAVGSATIGELVLPLIPDWYTDWTLPASAPFFSGYAGNLDSTGSATAALSVPANVPPSLIGLNVGHACAVLSGGAVVAMGNAVFFTLTP